MESDNKINKKKEIEIDSDDMDYSFSSSESETDEKETSKINEALLEKEEICVVVNDVRQNLWKKLKQYDTINVEL